MASRYKDKPYTIFPRKLPSGKTVFYYQAYDGDGVRTNPMSTGIGFTRKKDESSSRRKAEAYCLELFKHNNLNNSEFPILSDWIKIMNFWDYGRSTYVKEILARSDESRPGITMASCIFGNQITRDHILPYHGNKRINEITPYDCERLLFLWADSGMKKSTINRWKSIYSTMLGEYERRLKMRDQKSDYFNPWRIVKPLKGKATQYGALTVGEVQKILSFADTDTGTPRKLICYTATKLAFMSGMRIGEVCGLFTDDIIDVIQTGKDGTETRLSYLHICKQWSALEKARRHVKDKDVRNIPISAELRDELDQFITGSGKYLFSFHPRGVLPMPPQTLRRWFNQRLEESGVTDRVERNIAFHSSRRFFNTLLRHGNVADDMIRRFTGHDSQEMTDHYTDYLPEDMQAISRAQTRLLTGGME